MGIMPFLDCAAREWTAARLATEYEMICTQYYNVRAIAKLGPPQPWRWKHHH